MKKFLILSTAAILTIATTLPSDAGWRGRRDTAIGIGIGLGVLGAIAGGGAYYSNPYGYGPSGGNYYGNPDAGYYGDYYGSYQGRTYYPPPQYYSPPTYYAPQPSCVYNRCYYRY